MKATPGAALQLRSILPVVLLDPEFSGAPPVITSAAPLKECLYSIRDLPEAVETVAKFLTGALPEAATFFSGYAFVTNMGVYDWALGDYATRREWDRAFTLIRETSPVPVQTERPWTLIKSGDVVKLTDNRDRSLAGTAGLFLSEAEKATADMKMFSTGLQERLLGAVPDKILRCYFGTGQRD